MDNLTLTCSCKTSMVPVETLGEGHFRCPKCRTRVHVATPFGGNREQCAVSLGSGKRCEKDTAGQATRFCDSHVQSAAEWVLLNPQRRDDLIERAASLELFHEYRDGWNRKVEQIRNARAETDLKMPKFVYYVRLRPGCIKIGFSFNPKGRMETFRVWDRDELLAVEPGGRETERDRHRQFDHVRQRAGLEEFDESPDLMEHIAAVRSGHGEPWQAIDRMRALARRKKKRAEGRVE